MDGCVLSHPIHPESLLLGFRVVYPPRSPLARGEESALLSTKASLERNSAITYEASPLRRLRVVGYSAYAAHEPREAIGSSLGASWTSRNVL